MNLYDNLVTILLDMDQNINFTPRKTTELANLILSRNDPENIAVLYGYSISIYREKSLFFKYTIKKYFPDVEYQSYTFYYIYIILIRFSKLSIETKKEDILYIFNSSKILPLDVDFDLIAEKLVNTYQEILGQKYDKDNSSLNEVTEILSNIPIDNHKQLLHFIDKKDLICMTKKENKSKYLIYILNNVFCRKYRGLDTVLNKINHPTYKLENISFYEVDHNSLNTENIEMNRIRMYFNHEFQHNPYKINLSLYKMFSDETTRIGLYENVLSLSNFPNHEFPLFKGICDELYSSFSSYVYDKNLEQLYAICDHNKEMKNAIQFGYKNLDLLYTKIPSRSHDVVFCNPYLFMIGFKKNFLTEARKFNYDEYLEMYDNRHDDMLDLCDYVLKDGGKIVYYVNSFLDFETTQVIITFLEKHRNYQLIVEKKFLPTEVGEFFYYAVLQRN